MDVSFRILRFFGPPFSGDFCQTLRRISPNIIIWSSEEIRRRKRKKERVKLGGGGGGVKEGMNAYILSPSQYINTKSLSGPRTKSGV